MDEYSLTVVERQGRLKREKKSHISPLGSDGTSRAH
jgi:hypothetical protein